MIKEDQNQKEESEEILIKAKEEAEETEALETTESSENNSEETEAILEEKEKEDEEVLNRLMRLQADFENFKKRTQKEKADIYQFASEGLATKLLPVMDNLERAETSLSESEGENQTYSDGVQMVFKQLRDVLKEEGLLEIDCETKFDPNFHHGVAVGDSEEKEDQEILDVFQKGYSFKGKVIRPAMVKVCNK